MSSFLEVSPGVFVGGQPTASDLTRLKGSGIRTVIDLRPRAETLEANAELVAAVALAYLNIPVTKDTLSDQKVDAFRTMVERDSGAYLVHCSSGARAEAMMLMSLAVRNGWSSREALEHASALGFNCDAQPEIKTFCADYIDRRAKGSAPIAL